MLETLDHVRGNEFISAAGGLENLQNPPKNSQNPPKNREFAGTEIRTPTKI